MGKSSDGLIALLERKGINPTGESKKDLELAKSVMPKPINKNNKPKTINITNEVYENANDNRDDGRSELEIRK